MKKIYKMIIFIFFMVILYMILFPTKHREIMNLNDIQYYFDKLQSYQYREERDENGKVTYNHRDLSQLQRLPDEEQVDNLTKKEEERYKLRLDSAIDGSEMKLDETRKYYEIKDKIIRGLGDLNMEIPDERMDHYKFRDHLKDQLRIQELKQRRKKQRDRMETKEWWVKTWLKEWYESFFNIKKRYYTPYELKRQRMLEYIKS
jgi:hypothetical protein